MDDKSTIYDPATDNIDLETVDDGITGAVAAAEAGTNATTDGCTPSGYTPGFTPFVAFTMPPFDPDPYMAAQQWAYDRHMANVMAAQERAVDSEPRVVMEGTSLEDVFARAFFALAYKHRYPLLAVFCTLLICFTIVACTALIVTLLGR